MSGQTAIFPKFRQKNTEIEVWNGFESNLALPIGTFEQIDKLLQAATNLPIYGSKFSLALLITKNQWERQ